MPITASSTVRTPPDYYEHTLRRSRIFVQLATRSASRKVLCSASVPNKSHPLKESLDSSNGCDLNPQPLAHQASVLPIELPVERHNEPQFMGFCKLADSFVLTG